MGLERIAAAFATTSAEGRGALMPYYTLGYPDVSTCEAVVHAIADAGADLIELGVPFSDPLADGPTIQRSTQRALEQGMSVAGCLALTGRLRASGVTQPLLLMGYVNPILSYGVAKFAADAATCGADGLIVPDLPLEESAELEGHCGENGLALVHLAAPNTTEARLSELASRTSGFLYLVSVAGVTGARDTLPEGIADFVQRARRVAKTPVAVGFGIATPVQASAVGRLADGVIVGSGLIDAVDGAAHAAAAAREYVARLAEALRSDRNGGPNAKCSPSPSHAGKRELSHKR